MLLYVLIFTFGFTSQFIIFKTSFAEIDVLSPLNTFLYVKPYSNDFCCISILLQSILLQMSNAFLEVVTEFNKSEYL